jgi:hypothetical protein
MFVVWYRVALGSHWYRLGEYDHRKDAALVASAVEAALKTAGHASAQADVRKEAQSRPARLLASFQRNRPAVQPEIRPCAPLAWRAPYAVRMETR